MATDAAISAAIAPSPNRADWRRQQARRLVVTDALALIWVVFGTEFYRLGFGSTTGATLGRSSGRLEGISYSLISVVLIAAWLAALSLADTRSDRVIGTGSAEYVRVLSTSVRFFGVIAIVAFLLKLDLARSYVLIAFPLGTLALLATRWVWRRWLQVKREQGEYTSRVLLVGSSPSATLTASELIGLPHAGYQVVGACVAPGSNDLFLGETHVPVVGTFDDVIGAMRTVNADTVIITGSDHFPNDRVRQISWALEPGRQHLVVAPSIIDVGGPRIHIRPVAGLPLMHVETPQYGGTKLTSKRLFDIVASALVIICLSPVLIASGLAVRITSPGPILFRQERVGLNGQRFKMLKFRSMVVDAEARLAELRQHADAGNSVMFKMKDDPRVTPVGKFLRRYSIDELPQLFNVLLGSMSLVGPRPPLARELELYDVHTHRRFLVKPGITGLWQVSGRSNLSWDESVRLDLYYVENWSIAGDLHILWRTARAVFAREGAY